jgi:hypothetical protein
LLRRVQKLFALAESDNVHEAEAAAAQAQRLMLEHNLDVLQQRGRRYAVRTVGKPVTRMHAHEKLLASLLSSHYFVEVILVRVFDVSSAKNAHIVELTGTDENLQLASYVHGFLLAAAESTFNAERRRGRPPRDRLPYLAGFMMGVQEKLKNEKKTNAAQGLIWRGDADLEHFVRTRHKHLRRTKLAGAMTDAHAAGHAAGRDVVISKPVDAAPESRGRRLEG